jgi:hypothetical protein
MGRAETLLGVILDFDRLSGDRIVNVAGETLRLLPHRTPGADDKTAPPTTTGTDGDFTTTTTPPNEGTSGGGSGENGFGPTTVAPGGQPPSLLGPATTPLTRVDVDLDGDGVLDGYLLIAPIERGPAAGVYLDSETVAAFQRAPTLSRLQLDMDRDGVSDGYIAVGPRGDLEVTVTSVGVAFSHNDPFGFL